MTNSATSAAALAIASGVATALVPPARLPSRLRHGVHATLGLSTAAACAVALTQPGRNGEEPLALPVRAGVVTASGALVALTSAATMRADTAVDNALARRGVRHPRMWIGVASAVMSAAISWIDTRFEDPKDARAADTADGRTTPSH